jgi:hypothetical protein
VTKRNLPAPNVTCEVRSVNGTMALHFGAVA